MAALPKVADQKLQGANVNASASLAEQSNKLPALLVEPEIERDAGKALLRLEGVTAAVTETAQLTMIVRQAAYQAMEEAKATTVKSIANLTMAATLSKKAATLTR